MDVSEVDAGELVGEPLNDVPKVEPDEKCRGRRDEGPPGEKTFVGYCKNVAGKGTDHLHDGRCSNHGGAGGAPEENENAVDNDGGPPEDNENGVTHGAFAKNFQSRLTEDEKLAREDVVENLQEPKDAKQIGIQMAADYAIKYQRTGDPRLGKRFEAVCEKFGIVPAAVMEHLHKHDHKHEHDHDHELSEREISALDHVTGGPENIEVEVVEDADPEPTEDTDTDESSDADLEIGW